MPHYVASDLGLHCLHMTLLRASLQEWVNCKVKSWTFVGHSIHAILFVGLCHLLNCCDIDQFYTVRGCSECSFELSVLMTIDMSVD